MAELMSITIEGLDQMIAKCTAPIHAAPIKAAFTESASELKKAATDIEYPHHKTGALARSIAMRVDGAAIPTFAEVGLLGGGPSAKSGGKYGPWVHDGTPPHIIRPRKGKVLAWKGSGGIPSKKKGWSIARVVHHPGFKGRPFLTQALEQSRSKIEGYFQAAGRLIEAAWGK